MEIHAPSEPILTVRQAIVHLVIVTAGILIALSLEGAREWGQHRALMNEARSNLLREIRDNRKEVAQVVGSLERMKKDLTEANEIAQTLAEHRSDASGDTLTHRFNLTIGQLSTASRTTAEVTGAFGLMDYGEVKRLASVYDLQAMFAGTQDRLVESGISAVAAVQLWDPAKATPRELEDWTRQLRLAYAAVIAEQQIGTALINAYDEVPGEKR